MHIFNNIDLHPGIQIVKRVMLVTICVIYYCAHAVSTTESRLSPPETTSDFDSLLHLSKDMSINQIRHKGRSVFLEQKNPHGALLWYRTALNRSTDNFTLEDWESLARIYSNIGHIYFYEYGNAQQAFVYLMKSSEICDTKGHGKTGFALTDIYYTFADIYTSYNDLSKASYYLKKGFDVSLRKDIKKIGYSFANLAWFSILNDSVASIKKERELFIKALPPDTSVLVKYCRQIVGAMDHIDKGNFTEAARLADTALKDRTFATPDNPDITVLRYHAAALLIAAHLHVKNNDWPAASKRISETEKIVTTHRLFDLYDFLYKEKADYYGHTGNIRGVRECESRAMKVRDSLYNSQKYGLLRNIEEEWKVSEMESRLKKNEDERRILIIRQNKQQAIMLTMGISAAAVMFLLIWIFRKNSELKKANSNLFRKNIELADALSSSGFTRSEKTDATSPDYIKENFPDEAPASISEKVIAKKEKTSEHSISSSEKDSDEHVGLDSTFELIRQIMSESKEIYNPDFNIETLSHISGVHSRRISQTINSLTGKSFSTFVGEYRIAEACRQLTAPGIRPTIAAVAENVGYKSRTHFSTVFKAVTGMTTTEFIRQAKRNLDGRHKL